VDKPWDRKSKASFIATGGIYMIDERERERKRIYRML